MLIVDGHNLIPKIPGFSLRDIDDEERLAELLQEYARLKRKKVVVFFDGAPPGQSGERVYGMVRAHFVPAGRTADDAIRQYLEGMGKTARSATVVSSDRLVQANARELRAGVLSSEDFARKLADARDRLAARPQGTPGKTQNPPGAVSGAQSDSKNVDQWLDLFGVDPASAEKPIDLSKRPSRKPRSGSQKPGKPTAQEGQAPAQEEQENPTQKKRPRRYHGFPKKS